MVTFNKYIYHFVYNGTIKIEEQKLMATKMHFA